MDFVYYPSMDSGSPLRYVRNDIARNRNRFMKTTIKPKKKELSKKFGINIIARQTRRRRFYL